MQYKNYILDFEEAVADLTECYKDAFSTAFGQFDIPYDPEKITEYMSTPLDVLFGKYYKGCTCKYRDFVIMFMGAFDRAFPLKARLRDGIAESVRKIKSEGAALGIVSDSYEMYIRMLLSANGIEQCFSSVVGIERSAVARPDPYCTNICIREMGASAENTALVGTSDRNRETASGADIGFTDRIC